MNKQLLEQDFYRWVKASESPKTEGYYVCSVNNGFICSVYFNLKNGWFFNSSYAFQGQVKEWLEKIEADQQDLWDDVKIAFAKDIAAILSGVNSEPVNVNEIISKYFLIPKQ